MVTTTIIFLGCSIVSASLYHIGGTFNTKWRDLGVPFFTLLALYFIKPVFIWWVYLLSFLMTFGFLTCYWDFLTRLWRKDEREYWENWFLHGLFVGLSTIPCMLLGIPLYSILLRAILLAVLITLWSQWHNDVFWEETGRGFLIVATLPILLIGG